MKRARIKTVKSIREEKAKQIQAYNDMMKDLGRAVDEKNKLFKDI